MGAGLLRRGQASAGVLFYSTVGGKEEGVSKMALGPPKAQAAFAVSPSHPPPPQQCFCAALALGAGPVPPTAPLPPPAPSAFPNAPGPRTGLGLSPFSAPSLSTSTPENIISSGSAVVAAAPAGGGQDVGAGPLGLLHRPLPSEGSRAEPVPTR